MQISLNHHQGPVLGWSMHNELLLENFLRLSISDTGTGIDPGMLSRIFEPFFTTKKQNEGTGLGLSIVHGIMSRCSGFVSVESFIGIGSTFHLYFPVLGRQAQENNTQPTAAMIEEGPLAAAARKGLHALPGSCHMHESISGAGRRYGSGRTGWRQGTGRIRLTAATSNTPGLFQRV